MHAKGNGKSQSQSEAKEQKQQRQLQQQLMELRPTFSRPSVEWPSPSRQPSFYGTDT